MYNLQTRQEVAHLAAGEGQVRAAFSPADHCWRLPVPAILAPGKEQYRLRLWNTATRQIVAEFPWIGFAWGWRSLKMGGRW